MPEILRQDLVGEGNRIDNDKPNIVFVPTYHSFVLGMLIKKGSVLLISRKFSVETRRWCRWIGPNFSVVFSSYVESIYNRMI
jgi:hypothetical protein